MRRRYYSKLIIVEAADLVIRRKKFRLRLDCRYVDKRVPRSMERLDQYYVAHSRVEWRLSKLLTTEMDAGSVIEETKLSVLTASDCLVTLRNTIAHWGPKRKLMDELGLTNQFPATLDDLFRLINRSCPGFLEPFSSELEKVIEDSNFKQTSVYDYSRNLGC